MVKKVYFDHSPAWAPLSFEKAQSFGKKQGVNTVCCV